MGNHVVQVKAGKLSGVEGPGCIRFLGIPYGEPPAGPARFTAPVARRPWDGVRPAHAYGATALQPDRGMTIIPEPIIAGGDCLNLNVFTPTLDEALLTVLVWIHGGGFMGGCSASPWYDGAAFNRDGVVVVSINYRLGAEGFLSLQGAPDNRAVLDWLLALEWVQDNIAHFGGDPGKVTIAGQSAGGAACATLLAVPAGRGLFRAAICMSGSVGFELSQESAISLAEAMAAELGVAPSAAAFGEVSDEALLVAQERLTAHRSGSDHSVASVARALSGARLPWAPVVDGEVLAAPVLEAVATGTGAGIAVMAGTTAHEFNMAWRGATWVTVDLLRSAAQQAGLGRSFVDDYLARHPGWDAAGVLGQMVTDRTFRLPAHRLLAAHQMASGVSFGYEFRWSASGGANPGLSYHCLDLPFVFDVLAADGVAEAAGIGLPQELATAVHRSFVKFVTDLSPGWEPYDARRRATRILDVGGIGIEEDPLAIERELWSGAP